jgi:hypothetical protein
VRIGEVFEKAGHALNMTPEIRASSHVNG